MPTFGQLISERRKELSLSQREVAARLIKEDGQPISPQYLNDVERDRRNAPGDDIIRQLGEVLQIDVDVLYNCAGELPPDLRCLDVGEDKIKEAFALFRREVKKSDR